MLDLKLEASSLIYQEHFMRHNLQAKSKWNIGDLLNLLWDFLKERKQDKFLHGK